MTAGDHIDWMTTSPAAIRFTLSSNVFHSARKWPAFFSSISLAIVLVSSSCVGLPLSPYFISPAASSAMMASMMPMVGMFWIAALPLKSGESRSAQLVMSRPTRSGRMPSVSAL